MVLDTGCGKPVAQGQQKVIVVEVARSVELVRLPHQLAMDLEDFGADFEKLRFVCHHVEGDAGTAARIEVELLEMLPRIDRGINQRFKRDGLKNRHIVFCRSHVKGRAKLPALRKLETGFNLNLSREMAGRIKRARVPVQPQHLSSDGGAAL